MCQEGMSVSPRRICAEHRHVCVFQARVCKTGVFMQSSSAFMSGKGVCAKKACLCQESTFVSKNVNLCLLGQIDSSMMNIRCQLDKLLRGYTQAGPLGKTRITNRARIDNSMIEHTLPIRKLLKRIHSSRGPRIG